MQALDKLLDNAASFSAPGAALPAAGAGGKPVATEHQ